MQEGPNIHHTLLMKKQNRVICDEQLFSWLTVQSVLFVGQIISACCILQRQTMSTRNTLLDQRSKVLLLVFMLWTIIGVGFLGADNNTQESSCVASEDPVYNLAFKIIVFHVSVFGLYFLVRRSHHFFVPSSLECESLYRTEISFYLVFVVSHVIGSTENSHAARTY